MLLLLAHNRPRAISGPFLALFLVTLFVFILFFVWWLKVRRDESRKTQDPETTQMPATTKELEAEDGGEKKCEGEGEGGEEERKLGV